MPLRLGTAITALVVACQPIIDAAASRQESNPLAATLVDFRERIEDYMELREDVIDEVGDRETTRDPADIRGREKALATLIQERRAHAKHGDIFTPEIRTVFRGLLAPHATGEPGRDLRSTLAEDAPAPDAVPLEVNGKYPAGVPFPMTPSTVIMALPRRPPGLEYRILGKDLILLDQPADVIVDYMRNAIK